MNNKNAKLIASLHRLVPSNHVETLKSMGALFTKKEFKRSSAKQKCHHRAVVAQYYIDVSNGTTEKYNVTNEEANQETSKES